MARGQELVWIVLCICATVLVYTIYSYAEAFKDVNVWRNELNKIGVSLDTVRRGGPAVPQSYMIPSDDQLKEADTKQLFLIYWTYINTLQVLCMNQTRVGPIKDGGKEVCLSDGYKPTSPCIVYSFGSNNDFRFENDVTRLFGCEIHTFDPSRGQKTWSVPEKVKFHEIGLSGETKKTEKGWQLKTLEGVFEDLGHKQSTIDILKFDIEGAEWPSIPNMIDTGALANVKQICVELHFNGNAEVQRQNLKTLRRLYEHGFRIFMHDRNPVSVKDNMTPLNELSLINVKLSSKR